MERVPVLMENDLAILGVVDATLPEAKLVLRVRCLERVVEAPLVDTRVLRLVVDRGKRRAEAEALDVLLRLGEPVVDHHLLKLILVPRVCEGVRGREREVAGGAVDVGVIAAQETAAVEVRQRDRVVCGCRHRGVGIFLVGERLVPQALHWIRDED
jgi:hypothetical protein